MHNPPHPGEILREDYLAELGLSVTHAARALGVARKTLSELLNGKSGISAIMAVRLAQVFGASPEFWLRLQEHYDLWHAARRMRHWKPKARYQMTTLA